MCKHSRICRRVGSWRLADRRLVDIDYLVEVLNSPYLLEPARLRNGPVRNPGYSLIKNLIDKGRLARARYSCYKYQLASRYRNIYVLKVVLCCTDNLEAGSVARSPCLRHLNPSLSGEELACNRFRIGHDLLAGSLGHKISSVNTCSRTNIQNIVSRMHGVLIVLYDNQSIAHVCKTSKRGEEPVVISLMKSYARLIEDI